MFDEIKEALESPDCTELTRINILAELQQLYQRHASFDEKPMTIADAEMIVVYPGSVASNHILPEVKSMFPDMSDDDQWKMSCKQAGALRKNTKDKLCQILSDGEDFESAVKASKNRRANKGKVNDSIV